MDTLEIGQLDPAEIDAAVDLWRDAGLTRPWNDPYADARLALTGLSSTVLAGRLSGELAATVMVGADGHRAWVYYLAVSAQHRGRRFGKAMMDAAEAWALDRGMPKLQLMVRADNDAVTAFYRAIGYRAEPVTVMAKRFVTST